MNLVDNKVFREPVAEFLGNRRLAGTVSSNECNECAAARQTLPCKLLEKVALDPPLTSAG
jgi:hypothetical protein